MVDHLQCIRNFRHDLWVLLKFRFLFPCWILPPPKPVQGGKSQRVFENRQKIRFPAVVWTLLDYQNIESDFSIPLILPLRFFQIRFYRCLYNSSLERKIHLKKIKILVYYVGNILTVVYINNTGELFLYCGDRNEVAFS